MLEEEIMPSRKSKQLSERMKSLRKNKGQKADIYEDIDTKILRISSEIKRCENDLNGKFQDNPAIINKLHILKKQKQQLENEKNTN